VASTPVPAPVVPAPVAPAPVAAPVRRAVPGGYELPPLELLALPPATEPTFEQSEEFLEKNSVKLQQTLNDFGVRGEIIDANPGPVVTLYELEPAPGTKSSRVIAVAPDIARSMSAVSARVAVVEGRNVIGIELPNARRETVYLRELLETPEFGETKHKLAVGLGKTIGGEPVIADLARMPHLLVAGTTGSGKSVAINTMILSLLYMHSPEKCRLIMVDPKMLELSVYEGIPHLLTPVVTDPKKAVIALKWAVREMEDRYRKMAKLGVRNIDGFNARAAEALAAGETVTRLVQTGFDRETGEAIHAEEALDLSPLPYIVIIVDEMADLMMVAGKEIEGAIQRLAQMARAAGIHLIMATQRPSVDVITGTIKANFPTRISFQVTSKIDSRTILGEMGAEQLLGQGDMLHMAGGGRITRVHGPFVSDAEVEKVVDHLKLQGRPEYLDEVTADEEELAAGPDADETGADTAVFDQSEFSEDSGDLYEQAVAVVLRDRKASTSYIQRRLQIGYNRAASLMERMEKEGIVGAANHAGKREIYRGA
ncbi:DNA translocase FtsK, partial [Methylopila musalis]